MQAIIMVLVLPPRESFSILVSLESLYGIWETVFFLEFSAKVFIQFPSASKLRLIFAPSCIFLLQFRVCSFSEPAKSIINNLQDDFSEFCFSMSTFNCKIAWDLEEYWLAAVEANTLLDVPVLIHWTISSSWLIGIYVTSATVVFPFPSSTTLRYLESELTRRSLTFSL